MAKKQTIAQNVFALGALAAFLGLLSLILPLLGVQLTVMEIFGEGNETVAGLVMLGGGLVLGVGGGIVHFRRESQ